MGSGIQLCQLMRIFLINFHRLISAGELSSMLKKIDFYSKRNFG